MSGSVGHLRGVVEVPLYETDCRVNRFQHKINGTDRSHRTSNVKWVETSDSEWTMRIVLRVSRCGIRSGRKASLVVSVSRKCRPSIAAKFSRSWRHARRIIPMNGVAMQR